MLFYRILFCLIICTNALYSQNFVLLLGPSGTGKSTLIRHLKEMDSRFVYISPYTTRELRPGEIDKIHVDLPTIEKLIDENKLLTVNLIYGIYYATPKEAIDTALSEGNIPILDWPIAKMDVMTENYGSKLLTFYIEPESIDVLKKHLEYDGRDKDGKRLAAGVEELERYYRGDFDHLINKKIMNVEGQDLNTASLIYQIVDKN